MLDLLGITSKRGGRGGCTSERCQGRCHMRKANREDVHAMADDRNLAEMGYRRSTEKCRENLKIKEGDFLIFDALFFRGLLKLLVPFQPATVVVKESY
ncbi:hypothetical protein E2562_010808 [Oryza meyeriana var. granulata]|uniref:Uncharacterized protein n=1 Tax=Oryza meyeriana var. granulata TaxID=110450 RepID=A0A6G1BJI4_9ORYZ|nr:hypothetical protein E2562_010808 [Oryza meyeriana var. granulata]